jgi:sugar O-acyltransferase (sialic acid O-acetyltransferase NeuD family)
MRIDGHGCVKIVVLGAGGTGLFMADCICNATGFQFVGFLDDDGQKQAKGYENFSVLGGLNRWNALPSEYHFLSSLYGDKKMQALVRRVENLGIPEDRWATFVDPMTKIGSRAKIGKGSFIGPGSIIEPVAMIGRRCGLLGNVYVAHHSVLDDYVVCANSVSISGGVSVGKGAYIGANASVRQCVRIDSFAIVGMGAVVLDAVLGATTVVGNPAKPMGCSFESRQT